MVTWTKASSPHPLRPLPRPTGLAVIDSRCCRAPPRRRAETEGELNPAKLIARSVPKLPAAAESSGKLPDPPPHSPTFTESCSTLNIYRATFKKTQLQALFQEAYYGELVRIAETICEGETEATKRNSH